MNDLDARMRAFFEKYIPHQREAAREDMVQLFSEYLDVLGGAKFNSLQKEFEERLHEIKRKALEELQQLDDTGEEWKNG